MKQLQKILIFLFDFAFWAIFVTINCALILGLMIEGFIIYKVTEQGVSISLPFIFGSFFAIIGIYIFIYFMTWHLQLMARVDDSVLKLEYSKMLSPVMTLPRNIFKTFKSS